MPHLRCSDVWGGTCAALVEPPTFLCSQSHSPHSNRTFQSSGDAAKETRPTSELPNNVIDFVRRRGWDDWETVQNLLNDPSTPEEILEEIWLGRNKALAVAMKLIESKLTSPTMLRRVWETWWMDDQVQKIVADHRNTPADISISLWRNHHVVPVGMSQSVMAELPGGFRHLCLFSRNEVPINLIPGAVEDGRYETSAPSLPDDIHPSNLVPLVSSGMVGTWEYHRQLVVKVCVENMPEQIAVGALGLAMINWRTRRIGFTELTNRMLDTYPNSELVHRSVSMVQAS